MISAWKCEKPPVFVVVPSSHDSLDKLIAAKKLEGRQRVVLMP